MSSSSLGLELRAGVGFLFEMLKCAIDMDGSPTSFVFPREGSITIFRANKGRRSGQDRQDMQTPDRPFNMDYQLVEFTTKTASVAEY
ncbi:hypothetical protein BST61_g6738 [Cercospora zeina]